MKKTKRGSQTSTSQPRLYSEEWADDVWTNAIARGFRRGVDPKEQPRLQGLLSMVESALEKNKPEKS